MKTLLIIEAILLSFLIIGFAYGQEHFLQLVFSEKMEHAKLLDVKNYTVYDNNLNEIRIHKIGAAAGDSIVVLFLNPLGYKTNYTVRVTNLTDIAGNLIDPDGNAAWFYFDGYDPDNEQQPYIIVKD